MRLFLGIPTAGAPAKPFVDSLGQLQLPAAIDAFERGIVTGNFVPAQRELIVERALDWNADLVAMCDDDVVPPPAALSELCAALLADASAALIGALYYARDGLRPMVVDGWSPDDTTKGWIPAFDDRTPVAVDGVGFGFVVFRTSALATLERPFFPAHVYVEKSAGRVRICNEDYLFCARLRNAGHRVILHPGVRCGHYDRARDRIAPVRWESPERSGVPRVLVQTGEHFQLVPIAEAPATTTAQSRRRADVTYLEVP